jgi:hypothetical protein
MATSVSARIKSVMASFAKFETSLAGLLIAYLQMYGATWHLVPAVTAIGAALAVLGVPNSKAAPAAAPPPASG